jgi:hypothetical protein
MIGSNLGWSKGSTTSDAEFSADVRSDAIDGFARAGIG